MKNITYRGFSSFIKALRKHVLAGTYANFWTEVHSRKHALVHSKFKLAGETQTIVYMNQLVDKMIELMPDITEQEMLDVINQVLRISFLFEDKYWFMISVNEVEQEAPVAADAMTEALEDTDVLAEEDNPIQQATDTLELIKDVEIDLDAELPEEDEISEELMSGVITPEQQVELVEELKSISREDELKALTVKELREILKARDVKFAPASKEAKLIELILGSE